MGLVATAGGLSVFAFLGLPLPAPAQSDTHTHTHIRCVPCFHWLPALTSHAASRQTSMHGCWQCVLLKEDVEVCVCIL